MDSKKYLTIIKEESWQRTEKWTQKQYSPYLWAGKKLTSEKADKELKNEPRNIAVLTFEQELISRDPLDGFQHMMLQSQHATLRKHLKQDHVQVTQTDRHIDCQTDVQSEEKTDVRMDGQMDRRTDGQTMIFTKTGSFKSRFLHKIIYKLYKQTDRQTDGQTDGQTGGWMDRQTMIYTNTGSRKSRIWHKTIYKVHKQTDRQ